MFINRQKKLANILLAEDSLSDLELFLAHMEMGNVHFNLFSVRDGEEAIEFLKKEGAHKKAPKPDLVFLDLNLPKKTGKEVLEYLKSNSKLKKIPAIILSGSDFEGDISSAYDLGAMDYVTKPLNYEKMKLVIDKIENINFEEEDQKINLLVG